MTQICAGTHGQPPCQDSRRKQNCRAGFFIDEDGTIATTWNAIEGASEITAIVDNGGKFSVSQIVDFSQALNLAILKIDIRSSKCLELSDEAMQDDDAIYVADPEQPTLLPALFSDSEAAENGGHCVVC